jgi:hypothetical protein
MPGRLFLSPVSKSGTLRRPTPGRWYAANDFLTQYSTDILVEGTVGYQQIVRGVPSVFAQPIYFAHALRDSAHPAHAAARGQWRGLLACFALQRWLQLPLDIERFTVGDKPPKPDPRANGVFRTVLQAQLPEPANDWRDWWLVRCDGTLLGATSPWSLFYPPAQSAAPLSIPWQRGGVLIDPIDHYDERRQGRASTELSLLAVWVDRVLAGQPYRWEAPAGSSWDRAVSLAADTLGAWKDDLAGYRRDAERTRDLVAGDHPEVAAPYSAFLRPIDVEAVAPESTLVLRLAVGGDVIVLKRHGLDAKQRVQGSTLVEDLDLERMEPEVRGAWRTRAGREIAMPYVFPEEVFLTSRLTRIPASEHAFAFADGEFALPLRKDVFRFFSYDDLKSGRLQLDLRQTEEAYIVRLTILLDGRPFTVERSYDKGSEVVKLERAPALAYWPDFVSDRWRHYLGLYAAPQSTTLTVEPVTIQGQALLRSPMNLALRPWVVWQSEHPLLGFVLHTAGSGEDQEVGLLLRADASQPPRSDRDASWRVAVDFGTSNTHLMVSTHDQPAPRPLEIKARTVILSSPVTTIEQEVQDAFFPATGELRAPFPTVLLRNEGWPAAEIEGDLYSPRFTFKPGSTPKTLVGDLKWGREGGGRSDLAIRAYLAILARAVGAEACAAGVARLTLHWSYPLSLPAAPQQAMRSFWQTVPPLYSSSGLTVTVADEGGRSESEAMSRSFASLRGTLPVLTESLSIAVDVGGGSADVGFWSAGRFLDQVSLKLAGNDLLVPLIRRRRDLAASLFEICKGGRPSDSDLNDIQEYAAVNVNALLIEGSEKVPQAIHGRLASAEEPWSIARTVIYLYFAGLTFYLGLHARRTLDRVNRHVPAILFGGKASGLLSWLSSDPPTLERILGGHFMAGLSFDDPDRGGISPTFLGPALRRDGSALPLKSEVAYGLLLEPLEGEKPTANGTTVVGELGWRTTRTAAEALPWDKQVDVRTLASLHAPDNLETGFATYFASTLAPRFASELGLDLEGLRALRLSVTDVEDTVRTLAAREGVLQPIFGGELRWLIDRYLEGVKGA